MKTFLACLFMLVVCVTLSNAYCFTEPLTAEKPGEEILGCTDSKGNLHQFGSRWRTKNCLDCFCSKNGVSCCSSYMTPHGFDGEKCERVFQKLTCTYKVVEKADHTKECPVPAWVG